MKPGFFLYARKSTDTEEKQVLSIEAQLVELRLLAQKEKLSIKEEFIEKMTAKIPGRPLFNQMLERLEKGEAQGIIAWHPDRLARNSVDGGRVIYLLDKGQIKYLKFPTFWFDNTPQGKFMLSIAFGQSKYYIDNLSENIKRGFRQKLRRGEWPRRAPIGYQNDKNIRKVILDPEKAPLIKKLFEIYSKSEVTLIDLRKAAPTWGLVGRSGRLFTKGEIHQILKNTFYYGLMKYNGEFHQGTHDPIITKEIYDKVQGLLTKPKPRQGKRRQFPLLGLATCFTCGYSITAERQKGHNYYRCTKKGKTECHEPYVRQEIFAAQIKKAIEQIALPDLLYQKLLAEWAKERSKTSQPVASIQQDRKKSASEIQMRIDRLLDAYLQNLVTQSEYQAKRETLLNEKIQLEEQIARLEQSATGWLEPCREFLEAAHQADQVVASNNLESQRDLVLKIGSNHRLAAKALVFDFNSPWLHLAAEKSAAPNGQVENHIKKIGSNFRLAAKTLRFDYLLPWRLVAATADFENWGGWLEDFRTACQEIALAA